MNVDGRRSRNAADAIFFAQICEKVPRIAVVAVPWYLALEPAFIENLPPARPNPVARKAPGGNQAMQVGRGPWGFVPAATLGAARRTFSVFKVSVNNTAQGNYDAKSFAGSKRDLT